MYHAIVTSVLMVLSEVLSETMSMYIFFKGLT